MNYRKKKGTVMNCHALQLVLFQLDGSYEGAMSVACVINVYVEFFFSFVFLCVDDQLPRL